MVKTYEYRIRVDIADEEKLRLAAEDEILSHSGEDINDWREGRANVKDPIAYDLGMVLDSFNYNSLGLGVWDSKAKRVENENPEVGDF